MEKAHLYVEKYSKSEHELLLDFVREDEFLYFRDNGDHTADGPRPEDQYEPTMLLLHNCVPMPVREEAVLTVSMEGLLQLKEQARQLAYNGETEALERPATVYLEIGDGARFADMILNIEDSAANYIDTKIVPQSGPFWPCTPGALGKQFELRIWNVGQGNTNSISDENSLTLFDFGASVYYSESQLEGIIRDHWHLFDGKQRISLIISHWDCDHYNMLTVVGTAFLKKLSCVVFPVDRRTLTAQRVAARIKAHCKYQEIYPPRRAISNRCGIQAVCGGSGYTLFTGEQCKGLNRSGLLLTVYSDKAMALLTADHSNYQVWGKMYSRVATAGKQLHVVVPHHGGDSGRTAVKPAAIPGIAAVSVGRNVHGHPSRTVLNAYRRARYTVLRTDHRRYDIVIPM